MGGMAEDTVIDARHLPASLTAATPAPAGGDGPPPASLGNELADLERERILDALEQCGGNQTRAAELLGMPRRTFVKRLTAYGVQRPRKPRGA